MHRSFADGWSVAQPHLITLITPRGARAALSDTVTGSNDCEASFFSNPKPYVCFGAPVTFLCDVLLIHNSYLVEDIVSLRVHAWHIATNCVASCNISPIGMSDLPILRSLQPRDITLTAFEVLNPHIKAIVSHPGRV